MTPSFWRESCILVVYQGEVDRGDRALDNWMMRRDQRETETNT